MKFLILLFALHAHAADLQVAVSANFTAPVEKLGAEFTEETGQKVSVVSGATGQLYTQVKNGAPFEIFLSADQDTATKLVKEKAAVEGSQFTYAVGKLALWSPKPGVASEKALQAGSFKHLSIGNPKLAPYGTAAQETLQKLALWDKLQGKIVQGESVTQAFQFVSSGNAELGFIAYSQIKNDTRGSYWMVPQEMYNPIRQDVVLLTKGQADPTAKKFLEFLKSDRARAVIAAYGYSSK